MYRSLLTTSATKPKRKLAGMPAEMRVRILPIEGNEASMGHYVLRKRLAIERWPGSITSRAGRGSGTRWLGTR
ncbi:MAG: hypothetical protein ACYTFZ_01050 [Planctomycetota bacterium]|jgi:hypothetical protein